MLVFITTGYARISHALGWTLGLTSILLLPLGASFFQLVKQSQLQATLRRNLVKRTVTNGGYCCRILPCNLLTESLLLYLSAGIWAG